MSKSNRIQTLILILGLVILGGVIFLFIKDLSNSNQMTFYNGHDERIRKVGRFVINGDHEPRVYAPGAYFEFACIGSSVELQLTDENRFGKNQNFIVYQIDSCAPVRIKLCGSHPSIKLNLGLEKHPHFIRICKATESSIGYLGIRGVRCKKLLAVRSSKKLFEFIGDSITCGNGSDSSQTPFGKGNWYAYHNAYMSYGPQLSRELHADWMLSAVSGIGLRSSCCGHRFTMPDVYTNVGFVTNFKSWNFSKQREPDIVFIMLGQNDQLLVPNDYENSYINFLKQLRGIYSNALFVCCNSPMSTLEARARMNKSIMQVVSVYRKNVDSNIRFFAFKKVYRSGYDKHPTLIQHREIMQELKNNFFLLF